MMRRIIVFLAAIAGMIGLSEAYNLTSVNWKYVTDPMGQDFQVCVANMPSGGVARTKEAAAEWNYAKFKFSFTSDGCSSGGSYPKANQVHQIDYGPLPGNPQANILAETYTWFKVNTPNVVECDMRFSNHAKWNTTKSDPKSDEYDWITVAAHEFGHCLGLAHSGSSTAVMYDPTLLGTKRRKLTQDDKDGRAMIYGN